MLTHSQIRPPFLFYKYFSSSCFPFYFFPSHFNYHFTILCLLILFLPGYYRPIFKFLLEHPFSFSFSVFLYLFYIPKSFFFLSSGFHSKMFTSLHFAFIYLLPLFQIFYPSLVFWFPFNFLTSYQPFRSYHSSYWRPLFSSIIFSFLF